MAEPITADVQVNQFQESCSFVNQLYVLKFDGFGLPSF